MSYNKQDRAQSFSDVTLSTAGKVTIFTTVAGLTAFLLVFLFNLGQSEIKTAVAQTATTSVNVLNTPPEFDLGELPREQVASASTSPTNSGDDVTFIATATDQNGAPYFLIVCATGGTAVAQAGAGDGSAPPICSGAETIAVSTSTVSGTEASVSTTTTEDMPEPNGWIAFACDDDADNPECSAGETGNGSDDSASPFVVNSRPTFTAIANDGPVNPGGVLTFNASTSDGDSYGGNDTMQLIVCVANDYSTTTNSCGPAGTIATSTFVAGTPASLSAATTTASPLPDRNDYDTYVFVVDEHGHEALGGEQSTNHQYEVANVAPYISNITLNNGDDIVLDTAAGETTGFTITYTVNDDNSCENSVGGSEIASYVASVYHTGTNSSSSCAASGDYNANDCYPSPVGSSVWNVSCTATTTGAGACIDTSDPSENWECTFPLWYIADPTDTATTSQYDVNDWRAAISAVDDDSATSTFTQSASGVNLVAFLSFALDSAEIPYGSLAPGDDVAGSTTINTAVRPTGNVGVDLDLSGTHMCPDTFPIGECDFQASTTATSSIAEYQQEYSATTTGFTYGAGTDLSATTTPQEFELNAPKATATSTQPTAYTYWGIQVPGTISFAGAYTGRNYFDAIVSEPVEW